MHSFGVYFRVCLIRRCKLTEMITKLSWDSLQVRQQAYRSAIFYKIHYGLVALGAAQLGMQRQQRASRHTHSLAYEVPLSRTNYYMYSFEPRTIRNWNNLPDAIVRAPTIDHLKAIFGLISTTPKWTPAPLKHNWHFLFNFLFKIISSIFYSQARHVYLYYFKNRTSTLYFHNNHL